MANYNLLAEIQLKLGPQAAKVLSQLRQSIGAASSAQLNFGNTTNLNALNAALSQLNTNLVSLNKANLAHLTNTHNQARSFGNLRTSILESAFAYQILHKSISSVLEQESKLTKFAQVNLMPLSATRGFAQQVRTTAIQTGAPSNQLIELSTRLSQAGLSQKDIGGMLQSKLLPKLLLSPEVGEVGDLVKVIVQLKNNFGLVNNELEDILSQAMYVSQTRPIDLAEIMKIAGRTFPLAQSSQLNAQQMLAMGSAIQEKMQLKDVSLLGTQMRTLLLRLQSPLTRTHLSQYGIETYERKGGVTQYRGAEAILEDIVRVFKTLPKGSFQQTQLVNQIGDMRTSIYIRSLIEGWEIYRNTLQDMAGKTKTLSETLAIAQDSVGVNIQKLKETFGDLVLTFAQSDEFRNGVKRLTEGLSVLKDNLKDSSSFGPMALGALAGGAGLYLRKRIGVGGLLGVGALGASAYLGDSALGSALGGGAAAGLGVGGLIGVSNPISLFVTALATATGAVVGFAKAMESSRFSAWGKEQTKLEGKLGALQAANQLSGSEALQYVSQIIEGADKEKRAQTKMDWGWGSYLLNVGEAAIGLTNKGPGERYAKQQKEANEQLKNRLRGQMPMIEEFARANINQPKQIALVQKYLGLAGLDPQLFWKTFQQEQPKKTPEDERAEIEEQRKVALNEWVSRAKTYQEARNQMATVGQSIFQTQNQLNTIGFAKQNAVGRMADTNLQAQQVASLMVSPRRGGFRAPSQTDDLLGQLREATTGFLSGKNTELWETKLHGLNSAFQVLTNSTSRLASTQDRLNQLENALSQKYSFAERYYTADHGERRKMDRAREQANKVIGGASLESIPRNLRGEVMSYMNSLSGIEIRGKTLESYKRGALEKQYPGFFQPEKNERAALLDKQSAILTDIQKLQSGLLESQAITARAYEKFIQATNPLTGAMNNFVSPANELSNSLKAFPSEVEHRGNIAVNLQVQGGEALRGFIQQVINENFRKTIPSDDLPRNLQTKVK